MWQINVKTIKNPSSDPNRCSTSSMPIPPTVERKREGKEAKKVKGKWKNRKRQGTDKYGEGEKWEDGKVRKSKAKGKSEEAEGKKKAEGR